VITGVGTVISTLLRDSLETRLLQRSVTRRSFRTGGTIHLLQRVQNKYAAVIVLQVPGR